MMSSKTMAKSYGNCENPANKQALNQMVLQSVCVCAILGCIEPYLGLGIYSNRKQTYQKKNDAEMSIWTVPCHGGTMQRTFNK